jgi:vacuolar protein sorting-associated protein 13A/C
MAPPLATLTAISILIEQPSDIPEPEDVASEHNLYFEVLELQPIRLSLSFERTDRVSGEEKYAIEFCFCIRLNIAFTDLNFETHWQS